MTGPLVEGWSPGPARDEEHGEMDVELATEVCTGRITGHGAHVLGWAPAGAEPVIWLSSQAVFSPDAAIRGGVPVCFPWFGSGRSGSLSPAHGFARLSSWRRVSMTDDRGVVTVVHELDPAVAGGPEFPFDYRAVLTARFGEQLDIGLAVTNSGAVPFSYEAALHTYLAVRDVTGVSIEGLDGATYLDKLTGQAQRQEGSVTIGGEVDRVYRSDADVVVVDEAGGRQITVSKENSASTIIWNPWVEKARSMSDFGDDEWRSMVCVETANVGDAAITLDPGMSHRMVARINVDRFGPGAPECT